MIFYSPLLPDLIRVRIKRQYLWSCQPWLKCFFYNQSYTGSEGCLSINERIFSISISNPALLATWLTLQRRRHYSLHNILCGSLTRAVYWKNVEQHIRVFCDDNDTLRNNLCALLQPFCFSVASYRQQTHVGSSVYAGTGVVACGVISVYFLNTAAVSWANHPILYYLKRLTTKIWVPWGKKAHKLSCLRHTECVSLWQITSCLEEFSMAYYRSLSCVNIEGKNDTVNMCHHTERHSALLKRCALL